MIVILGGGGNKPKSINKALQEDAKLRHENALMRKISSSIFNRQLNKEIYFSDDGMDLLGDLEFNEDGE